MGLRDDLADILAIQELSGGFLGASQKLREQAGQQALQQELPGLIEQGDFGRVAALAGAAGIQPLQTGVIEKLIAGQAKQAAAPALDVVQLGNIYPNASQAALQTAASLGNRDDQFKALGVGERGYQAEQSRTAAFGRQAKGFAETTLKDTGNQLRAATKPFDEERAKLEKAQGFLDAPIDPKTGKKKLSEQEFNAGISAITRYTSGGGTMTDTDILQTKGGGTLFADLQEAKNYWSGKKVNTATPSDIEALDNLLRKGLQSNRQARVNAVREAITSAIEQGDQDLFDKNGNPKPILAGPLLRNGLEFISYSPETGAVIEFKAGKKKTSIKQPSAASVEGQGVDVAGLAGKISQIKDPTRQAQAAAELQKFNKRTISKEQYDKFNSILDQVIGAGQ